MLDAGVSRLDAILYTHDHASHTQGIDDVRFLKPGVKGAHRPMARPKRFGTLTARFDFHIQSGEHHGLRHLYKPAFEARKVTSLSIFSGIPVTPFEQAHGFGSVTTGYRRGQMAYSTDVVELPETYRYPGGHRSLDRRLPALRTAPHPCPLDPGAQMDRPSDPAARDPHPHDPWSTTTSSRPAVPSVWSRPMTG